MKLPSLLSDLSLLTAVLTSLTVIRQSLLYQCTVYVCMYVCPKIYIQRALSKKSQSRRGLKQTETSSVPV